MTARPRLATKSLGQCLCKLHRAQQATSGSLTELAALAKLLPYYSIHVSKQ